MYLKKAGGALVLCLLSASVVGANAPEVVTNPTPALSATMTLVSDPQGCFRWNVQGKVKPAYRGYGASVQLVCMKYSSLSDAVVFPRDNPNCDGACAPAPVDNCGNFDFDIVRCGPDPQLDNSYFCSFAVHVDVGGSPQNCGNGNNNTNSGDPNGSAPCSGGFCPTSP